MKNVQYTTAPEMAPFDFIEVGRKKFSCGWKVELPHIKNGEYTIIPKVGGQLNLFY